VQESQLEIRTGKTKKDCGTTGSFNMKQIPYKQFLGNCTAAHRHEGQGGKDLKTINFLNSLTN